MISEKDRIGIIRDNFFEYLNKKGITNKKYALDNNVDITTLSKWKSGTSNMTVEQIYDAAKYFDISVNDLYYSEKEKKIMQLTLFKDEPHIPINAQQILIKRDYNILFKNYSLLLAIFGVFISIIFTCIFVFSKNDYSAFVFSIITICVFMFIISRVIRNNKTYIIDYLDEIYYMRENKLNKKSLRTRVYGIVQLFSLIIVAGIIGICMEDKTSKDSFLYIVSGVYCILNIILSVLIIIDPIKTLDLNIKDITIGGIYRSIVSLLINLAIVSSQIILLFYNFKIIYSLVLSILVLILSMLEYKRKCKLYGEYILMYEKNGKEPRKLY